MTEESKKVHLLELNKSDNFLSPANYLTDGREAYCTVGIGFTFQISQITHETEEKKCRLLSFSLSLNIHS